PRTRNSPPVADRRASRPPRSISPRSCATNGAPSAKLPTWPASRKSPSGTATRNGPRSSASRWNSSRPPPDRPFGSIHSTDHERADDPTGEAGHQVDSLEGREGVRRDHDERNREQGRCNPDRPQPHGEARPKTESRSHDQ